MAYSPAPFLSPFPDPMAGGDRMLEALTRVQQARERAMQQERDQSLGWAKLAEQHRSNLQDEQAARQREVGLGDRAGAEESGRTSRWEGTEERHQRATVTEAAKQLSEALQRGDYPAQAAAKELIRMSPGGGVQDRPWEHAAIPAPPTGVADLGLGPEGDANDPAFQAALENYQKQLTGARGEDESWREQTGMAPDEYTEKKRAYETDVASARAPFQVTFRGKPITEIDPRELDHLRAKQAGYGAKLQESDQAKQAYMRAMMGGQGMAAASATAEKAQQDVYDKAQRTWEVRFQAAEAMKRAQLVKDTLATRFGVTQDLGTRMAMERIINRNVNAGDGKKLGQNLRTIREGLEAVRAGTALTDVKVVASLAKAIAGGQVAVYEQRMAQIGGVPEKFESFVTRLIGGEMGQGQRKLMLEGFLELEANSVKRINEFATAQARIMSKDPHAEMQRGADYVYFNIMEGLIPGYVNDETLPPIFGGRETGGSTTMTRTVKAPGPIIKVAPRPEEDAPEEEDTKKAAEAEDDFAAFKLKMEESKK
jgi:hypothetical protein